MRADWQLLGVDPDQARAANEPEQEPEQVGDVELPPELWPAWQCFLATWNQWRVIAGMGGVFYEGIDHAALQSCMELLDIKKTKRRDVFLHVLTLEDEARKLRNAKT